MTLEEKIKNAKAILDVVKDYPEKLQEKVFVYLVGDDFPSAENNQVEDVESLASDIEKNQIPQKKKEKEKLFPINNVFK